MADKEKLHLDHNLNLSHRGKKSYMFGSKYHYFFFFLFKQTKIVLAKLTPFSCRMKIEFLLSDDLLTM